MERTPACKLMDVGPWLLSLLARRLKAKAQIRILTNYQRVSKPARLAHSDLNTSTDIPIIPKSSQLLSTLIYAPILLPDWRILTETDDSLGFVDPLFGKPSARDRISALLGSQRRLAVSLAAVTARNRSSLLDGPVTAEMHDSLQLRSTRTRVSAAHGTLVTLAVRWLDLLLLMHHVQY